jgi:hypothetical protein
MPNLAFSFTWEFILLLPWALANEHTGVYAKYSEWYWPRINVGVNTNVQKQM